MCQSEVAVDLWQQAVAARTIAHATNKSSEQTKAMLFETPKLTFESF